MRHALPLADAPLEDACAADGILDHVGADFALLEQLDLRAFQRGAALRHADAIQRPHVALVHVGVRRAAVVDERSDEAPGVGTHGLPPLRGHDKLERLPRAARNFGNASSKQRVLHAHAFLHGLDGGARGGPGNRLGRFRRKGALGGGGPRGRLGQPRQLVLVLVVIVALQLGLEEVARLVKVSLLPHGGRQ